MHNKMQGLLTINYIFVCEIFAETLGTFPALYSFELLLQERFVLLIKQFV